MSNARNTGILIGRLADDPQSFTNRDGSKKVRFTLMVDRNYKNRQNVVESDAIDLEAFVSAATTGNGPFDIVHKGDLVSVQTTLRKDVYTKNGGTVYELKVIAEDISFLEPKAVTQARLAKRNSDGGQTPAPAPAPAPAAQAPVAQNVQVPAQVAPAPAVAYDEPTF